MRLRSIVRLTASALLVSSLLAPVTAEDGDRAAVSKPQDDEKKARPSTSLTQSLQGEGGVSIQTMCTNCNSADLSLGGLGNAHIEMTCDGLPVPPGLAQIYLLSILPPTVIDNVEVVKGAGNPDLDGGAVGGEIEIRRRKPEETFGASVSADTGSYGWNAGRADVEATFGRVGLNVTGSAAESDRIFADADDVPDSPLVRRYTMDGRVSYRLDEGQEIRLGVSNYQEEQEEGRAAYELSAETWNLENVDFSLKQYDLVYEGKYRDGSQLLVGGAFGERESLIEETLPATLEQPEKEYFPSYDIDDQRSFARARYARPMGLSTYIRAGGSWEEREMSVVDVRKNLFDLFAGLPLEEVFTRAQGETITERGVWAEVERSWGGNLDLLVGARWVDFTYTDNFETTYRYSSATVREAWRALPLPEGSRVLPRAALTWKPQPAWSLRVSAGTGYRVPDPTYEEVCCGRRFRGNRGLQMEESWSTGLEATYQPSADVQITGNAFWTDFENLVVKMVTISNRFQPTYQNVNVPEARYLSLGLQGRATLAPWISVKGSWSWLDAENETPADEIPAIILNFSNLPEERVLVSNQIPYVAETSGTVGVELGHEPWGLSVSADAQYQGPMLIQTFESAGIDDELGFRETSSFWITNLRVTQRLGAGVALFAGVDNIGDEVQEDLRDPSTDYTWGPLRGRYYYGGLSYTLGE